MDEPRKHCLCGMCYFELVDIIFAENSTAGSTTGDRYEAHYYTSCREQAVANQQALTPHAPDSLLEFLKTL